MRNVDVSQVLLHTSVVMVVFTFFFVLFQRNARYVRLIGFEVEGFQCAINFSARNRSCLNEGLKLSCMLYGNFMVSKLVGTARHIVVLNL